MITVNHTFARRKNFMKKNLLLFITAGLSLCANLAYSQNITTVAGNGTGGFSGDGGAATSAQLSPSYGVTKDNAGNLYITTPGEYRVRMVNPGGTISTIAGNGTYGYSGDGGPATSASMMYPLGVVADNAGNIYSRSQRACCAKNQQRRGDQYGSGHRQRWL
jgi:hypothetical protein